MQKYIYFFPLFFLVHFVSAQQRVMTTDDGLDIVNLNSALMSPNGGKVIYGKSELDWAKNKRNTKYHIIDTNGENDYQYIGESQASSLQYSPNGKYVSLKRKSDKFQQIYLVHTGGGEAVKITSHTNSIGSYKWSRDSKNIYFVSSRTASKDEKKEKKDGYDHIVIDEGPNGQQESSWNYIYRFNLDSDTIIQVTSEDQRIGSWDISPDGTKIAFTSRKGNRRNQGNLSEIFLLNIADKSTIRLTNNNAPEGNITWAPNSREFIYRANDDKEWELRQAKLWMMDITTKTSKLVSGAFGGNIRSSVFWSTNSKNIYFSGLLKTVTNLYSLNVVSGKLTNLSKNKSGSYRLRDMSRDRKSALLSYDDSHTTADLYVSSTVKFNPKKLTNLNPDLHSKLKLTSSQPIQWTSKDGLEIEGLLYLPIDYDKNKKYPFLLHIHGGPAGVFTDSYSSRYHVWAGLGYVQLCPNIRGSTGYSDKLLRGNMKDIGGQDFEDLMSGVDFLIKENYIDKSKMAVRGWSYGGILGGMTITKTNRFKAASLGAMVSDWTSEFGIGFNFDVKLWYIGGTPWNNPKAFRSMSPLTNAKNVTTPLILFHGANDRTDTEVQSMMFFAALKDMGKTVRYLRFPREPHGFREPRHQRTRDIEEISWIQKHTLGLNWEPWKRKGAIESDKKEDDIK
ncbi:MAG: S9 family peptidase [Saprospiraceae bacterium]